MKWIKVFSVFVLLHIVAWAGAHFYKSKNPTKVLLVADTSFALKPHFGDMQKWIDNYVSTSRYIDVQVGTDKTFIGPYEELKSADSLFRVSFGRSNADSLKQYASHDADERIFLSDGHFPTSGWNHVTFK